MNGVTIDRYEGRLHAGGATRDYLGRLVPDGVSVMSDAKVELRCGCHVFTGMRLDRHEPAYLASPCSMRHRVMIDRFQELTGLYPFKVGGSKRLEDHIADLLQEAASERAR